MTTSWLTHIVFSLAY